jgi:hypothetical protein
MRRSKFGTAAALAVLIGLFLALPAAADHRANHPNGGASAEATNQGAVASDKDGDADSNPGTAFTEDNDSDGVANNIADEGDNAHPSGKDRSVESGSSGNQGKAESKPDQNGTGPERDNRGTDKANGPGGSDILDQDGNNGCGNDDDFDDDNEGWCGGKDKPPSNPPKNPPNNPPGNPPSNPPSTTVGGTTPGSVLGVIVTRGREEGAVLGTEAVREQALAVTGTGFTPLLVLSLILIAMGASFRALGRKEAVSR